MKGSPVDEDQREASPRHTINTSRRQLLYLLGAGSLAGIAGCSSSPGEGTGTGTEPDVGTTTTTPTETEKLQKGATIGIPWNVTDGYQTAWGMTPYWARVFDPLTYPTQELEAAPNLATDWKAPDEKTWEFELREGVTFHNGDPLNAERVIGSFEKLFNAHGWVKGALGVKELSTSGDMTFVVTHDSMPNLPEVMTHPFYGIQHPDSSANQKWGGVIATGPYKLESIKPDQHVKLSAFEDYWQGPPKMEELTLRYVKDDNTRALALAGGRIDVAVGLSPSQFGTLNSSKGTGVETQISPTTAAYFLNQYASPTDDIKLRKALNYAVSQEKVIEAALNGVGGEPARGIVPRMLRWSAHDSLPEYGPDQAKAKELVEQSDYNGETLTLLSTPEHPFAMNTNLTAQVVQQQAKDVGVDIEIQTKEFGAFDEAEDNIPEKDFHLWIDGSETVSAVATRFVRDFTSEGSEADTVGDEALKKLDPLFQKGLRTQDPKVRKDAWGEMQHILVEEMVIMIPLYYHNYIAGFSDKIKEFDWHPLKASNRWENFELLK